MAMDIIICFRKIYLLNLKFGLNLNFSRDYFGVLIFGRNFVSVKGAFIGDFTYVKTFACAPINQSETLKPVGN